MRPVAMIVTGLFLAAILLALAITMGSVASSVALIAVAAVAPFVGLSVLFLWEDARGRRWGFSGATALGALGALVRLLVNSQPQLEVGGGLPLWVTLVYLGIAGFTVVTNFLAWRESSERRDVEAPS